MSLQQQILLAQKSLRDLKRSPVHYLLPQYGEPQQAKADFERAKARLTAAKAAWKQVGEPIETPRKRTRR